MTMINPAGLYPDIRDGSARASAEQHIHCLQAKLRESDAAAAAMRVELEAGEHDGDAAWDAALSPDAGKDLLERVGALEESLRWALDCMRPKGFQDATGKMRCVHCDTRESEGHAATCSYRKAQELLK